ncbi:MAG: histidine kinase dimerization/phospho-acceptor domain-containing protein, partial [Chthoniobacterales bacterium]
MRPLGFRGRVVLWSVVVVTAALGLLGAGAAWNLRRELLANLDGEIREEAAAVDDEIGEQEAENPLWKTGTLSEEDLSRFLYVELRDAAERVLYRSPALGREEVFPRSSRERPYEVNLRGRRIRFAQFRRAGITFVLGKDLQSIDESLEGLLRSYLLTLPLVIVAVGAGGWLIARRALTPIRGIIARAEKISASGLHQRMPPPPAQDEIGDLTNVLNEMFDRLQRSFEQVTRFTSDASHELKTPLSLMQAEVENALSSPSLASGQRQLLSDLSEQCSRLAQIIDGLLLLSRADDRRLVLEQEQIDLVALV